MACESTGKNDRRVNQFNKIKLLDNIANQIIENGIRYGNQTLMDKVDMACGGIPEGDFDQVIDLSSPHQFLSMYMQIAENRFAMAVTELLKMSPDFMKPISDFCYQMGKGQELPAVDSAQTAFEILLSFVLDGMPCDETKQIVTDTPQKVEWTKLMDTHEQAWQKAGGNLSVYYELQENFVKGLFAASKIEYKIEDCSKFSLSFIS